MLLADQVAEKAAAAARALELVRPGMRLGLGTGSTAAFFIEGLGRLVHDGLAVTAVATSRATAARAELLGIPLDEDFESGLDLAVDGADEIDASLCLIKGRGGALLREKVVAASAQRFVVIADEAKLVERLGAGVLPVEVATFGWRTTAARLERLGAAWTRRLAGGDPYVTDNGNWILDLSFEAGIPDPTGLAARLAEVPGVLEHGLFVGLTSGCIVGVDGKVRELGSVD